jgi:hypothetical protein
LDDPADVARHDRMALLVERMLSLVEQILVLHKQIQEARMSPRKRAKN